ncbi:MAG: ABC transporter permease, partial [Sinomicrobium sp.]|nr:ABC transporter permease [Sinomicrobium sp.]
MNEQPPKRALRFLRWFCRSDYLEEIEGNLFELFEQEYEQSSRRANWRFTWQVLRHFRPDFIKPLTKNPIIHPAMLKHNFLITWRGFMRNKNVFLINLIGLSTGLACALMIYLWVHDEASVDNLHEKDSQLYQVMHNNVLEQGIETADNTPSPLPAAWKAEMPEVEYAVQTTELGAEGLLTHGEKTMAAKAFFAGPDFFRIFSFSLLQGDKDQSLNSQNGIILSERLAKKLFGTTDHVIGKSLTWEHDVFSGPFQVAGIVADVPSNSTLQFDLIFHYQVFLDHTKSWETGEWYTAAGQTYLILQKGTDINRFNAKIADYLKPKSRWTVNSTLFVQRYSERYLYGRYENGRVAGGRIAYVRLFSVIGLFILLIAGINFMNLSTAQASRKMKEIGVKKVIGADRKALVVQYLSES